MQVSLIRGYGSYLNLSHATIDKHDMCPVTPQAGSLEDKTTDD